MPPVMIGGALAPFGVPSYRYQWPADLAVSLAIEMEVLILGWYILAETGRVEMLGLYGALLFVGTCFAPLYGVIGDRSGPRRVLVAMRLFYAVLATTIAGLAATGRLLPWMVFVLAGFTGCVRPAEIGMRNSLVADTVPAELMTGALGISRSTSDMARVVGALTGAGLFVVLGLAAAYTAVVALYGLGIALTLGTRAMRTGAHSAARAAAADQPNVVRASPWSDLGEGLKYVWDRPNLHAAMWLAFLANLVAYPISGGLLPYVARNVYKVDQAGLGYLSGSFALGALVGSLLVSQLGQRAGLGRLMLSGSIVWYVVLAAFAQATSAWQGALLLLAAGLAQSISIVSLAIMLARTSEPRFRGRVMGVRMLAIYSLPFGLMAAGWLIAQIGYQATATLYAVTGLVLTALIWLRWQAVLWPRQVPANAP